MRPLTIFLSRLIGIFALVFSLAMILHREAFAAVASAMVHNPPLLFLVGLITLAVGLAMVLAHNIWAGGALPVVITLFGWITLIRGLAILLVPPDALASFFDKMNFDKFSYGPIAITLVLGLYLTYAGFRQPRP